MTKEEIMELMHRELDGDLTKEEQRILQQELAHSPAYQEIYAELSLLSSQLEALPKVNPPTNIVDTILPVLEKIDQQGRGSASKVNGQEERGSSSVSLQEKKKLEQREAGLEDKQQRKGRFVLALPRKRLWIPSVMVAAAIMLVVIAMYDPMNDQNNSLFSVEDEGEMHHTTLAIDEVPDMFPEIESRATSMAELVSPHGQYVAYEAENAQHIAIEQLGQLIFSSEIWGDAWSLEYAGWMSNEELYYVLVDSNSNQREYRMINMVELEEIELDAPREEN